MGAGRPLVHGRRGHLPVPGSADKELLGPGRVGHRHLRQALDVHVPRGILPDCEGILHLGGPIRQEVEGPLVEDLEEGNLRSGALDRPSVGGAPSVAAPALCLGCGDRAEERTKGALDQAVRVVVVVVVVVVVPSGTEDRVRLPGSGLAVRDDGSVVAGSSEGW